MKNYLLLLIALMSFSLSAQNFTVTVNENGSAAEGVAVFFFETPGQFYIDGYNQPPRIYDFYAHRFTDVNGQVTIYTPFSANPGDTVYYAAKDCNGTLYYDFFIRQSGGTTNPSSGSLNISCKPGDCDFVLVSNVYSNSVSIGTYFLRHFSNTSLTSDTNEVWTVNGQAFRPAEFGNGGHDTLTGISTSQFSLPLTISYSRQEGVCSPETTVVNNGTVVPVQCNVSFSSQLFGPGTQGFGLQLSNHSSTNGTIINSHWDFGDSSSVDVNHLNPISHVYADTGYYKVCLTITSVLGSDTCVSTACHSNIYVGLIHHCNAGFYLDTVVDGNPGYSATIVNTSSSNGTIIGMRFFGTGSNFSAPNLVPTIQSWFASQGNYYRCLEITSVMGTDTCVSVYCDTLAVFRGGGSGPSPINCMASFTYDTLGGRAIGYDIRFNSSSATNGTVINYQWDFGDGNTLQGGNVLNPLYTYSFPGTYQVCLTITSVLGNDTCVNTYCDSAVVVPNFGNSGAVNCYANFVVDTFNSGRFQNQLIVWEQSISNGNIVSYSWDFGDGTVINSRYPSHTYANNGVYYVCLSIIASNPAGDSCTSVFCDSIGYDSTGALIYKGQAGFTINIIDPSTIGLEEETLLNEVQMYPNPAAEKLILSWKPALKVETVSLISLTGQEVMRILPGEKHELEIRDIPSGAYLVRLNTQRATKTLRLIVQ
ncbi:PKD domain-containing protein [Croceimicrobium hydrocarbonivorans]|uniref:PKD domain-containing protein n=1 Tax=Croceimicrobium hydrocarbonivorans TaxID=2761580 RepID=A0A7H0VC06_9FLAO|nr:PKD domain-containing protein [Croceimicrobium hydrocarbonivorans]QNR23254.1 PKD domain-containing protein [Croceimicrobium hydrocarbonivorans]